MKVLLIENVDGSDMAIDSFEENFTVEEIYNELKLGEVKVFQGKGKKSDYFFEASSFEFGEVDPLFVSFVINEIQDCDSAKYKDFYIVENKKEEI